ncbi:hypothetical protein [Microbacterium sp. CPCC 204701]|uniref:hypothetical protein n=1 Tax=Microbacterium sp. CPCC 204701 TaxID=2493084 RepID=UPI000FD74054|nr:hypothetical protein [Microbacterium sp. CPCC 204701]
MSSPATYQSSPPAIAAPIGHLFAVSPGPLQIDGHLNGPRRTANGGFAAGTIATRVDSDTVTVVLRRPIRMSVPLEVSSAPSGGVVVRDEGALVAEARPGRLVASADPPAPTFDDARRALEAHPLIGVRHALSDCVVCGPARADGMHVTPGPVPGRPEVLAAPWVVGARYAHAGMADFPAVWAAMDCPSFPAAALRERVMCVLGTMTARVERRPFVGEPLVVYAWTREHHGRRYETSVVMVDAGGAQIARADSTWIAVKHQHLVRLFRHLV